MVLSVNKLAGMMKNISETAKLSRCYTNHSIRATAITILDQNGVEARHIMSLSGHRNASSLQSYCKTSENRKREISSMLSSATGSNDSSTVNKRPCSNVQQISSTTSTTFNLGVPINEKSAPIFNFENCQVNIQM